MKRDLFLKNLYDQTHKGKAKPVFVKNSNGVQEVYIYDEIGAWGITAQDFVNDVNALTGDFDLHINSGGGDVFDGLAIYNTIKQAKGFVTVYVDGLAASAASFIAMAGDKVIMAKNASIMIHDASTIVMGNAEEMQQMLELLDKQSDNIASIYADKAGGTSEDWRSKMKVETWYNAEEALAAGLVDEIQGAPKDEPSNSLATASFKYSGRDVAPAPAISNTQPTTPPAIDVAGLRNGLKEMFK
jgi:ATP-dependent Clp endopeptidase proteolytic subunit ClpP